MDRITDRNNNAYFVAGDGIHTGNISVCCGSEKSGRSIAELIMEMNVVIKKINEDIEKNGLYIEIPCSWLNDDGD